MPEKQPDTSPAESCVPATALPGGGMAVLDSAGSVLLDLLDANADGQTIATLWQEIGAEQRKALPRDLFKRAKDRVVAYHGRCERKATRKAANRAASEKAVADIAAFVQWLAADAERVRMATR